MRSQTRRRTALGLSAVLLVVGGAPVGARVGGPTIDRTTAPTPVVSPDLVSIAHYDNGDAYSVTVPNGLLPFTYHVERSVLEQIHHEALRSAMAAFDGIPGSRWATRFAGIVPDGNGSPAADGRSTVFLEDACSPGVAANTYRHHPGAVDHRFGARASYLQDIDVGLCRGVTGDQVRGVLVHEMGHVLGMQHLCEPGERCHQPGMGPGPHRCRLMYAHPTGCRGGVTSKEWEAARTLYPTLRRLAGPSRYETAARTSWATAEDRRAGTVVVARGDGTAHGPLAAAALAAAVDSPLLLGTPDEKTCLDGPAADELKRVSRTNARTVFVGSWPASCERTLLQRLLLNERIDGRTPAALATAVADRTPRVGRATSAILVSSAVDTSGSSADGLAAGAAAAALGAPVLFTAPDALSPPTRAWLRDHSRLTTVYLAGGPATLDEAVAREVEALGLTVVRVSGIDRVGTALAFADLSGPAPAPVVITGGTSWADAVAGTALAGRIGAPLLLSPATPHPDVEAWLERHRPVGGYVVGGTGVVAQETQTRYTRHVRAAVSER